MKKKRLISLAAAVAMFLGSVSILPARLGGNSGAIVANAEQIRINATIQSVSQVYIGEIIVDGETKCSMHTLQM